MSHPPSSHRVGTTARRGAPNWARRTALLGSIVVGLALVGDQAMAGNRAPGAYVRSDVAGDTHWLGLTLALNLAGTAQRSLTALSDGSAEVVSLLVVGFSLIGVSRVLKRQRQEPSAPVQRFHEARPAAGVTSLATHALTRSRQESRGRAAG